MQIISLLSSVQAPSGLWSILINWIHNGIGNFGWTILLLTFLIKIVTSPLDFLTKLSSKKQSLIQQKCAPQVAKIQKKFGQNTKQIQAQTSALYKREGLNTGLGCLIMATNLILTLVIFFSFFSSFRSNSAYQAITQYETLIDTYDETALNYLISKNDEIEEYEIVDEDSAVLFVADLVKGKNLVENPPEQESPEAQAEESTGEGETPSEGETPPAKTNEEYINLYNKYQTMYNELISTCETSVINKWNEIKSSWLWVDNIWVSDAPVYPFLSYNNFISIANGGGKDYVEYAQNNIDQNEFTKISNLINEKGGRKNNGFLILAALSAIATFLSQFISERHTKLKNKKANQAASLAGSMDSSMKIMKFVMPVIMVVFVLRSSASFGIYIVSSSISSILLGEISNLIISKITYKKQQEVEAALEKEANRLIKKGKLQEKK